MAEQNQAQQPQVQLKITDEILKGAYANVAQVAHNREEFQLNFVNLDLTAPVGSLIAKLLISPAHMKRIVAALTDNLKRYEAQFGSVEQGEAPAGADKIGFKV